MSTSPSLQEQIDTLSSRVSTIENALTLMLEDTEEPQTAPAPAVDPRQLFTHTATEATPDLKTGNWLGIVGVICFVFAAAFIIKLAIDSGWLTPERQIGLAGLFGFSLIGFGLWFSSRQREYGALLPAGGIIVLYLSTIGAFRIHELINADAALATTAVVSAFCIWLYTRIKHDIYPITASIGAYTAPIILGVSSRSDFSIYYFVVCSMAFGFIAARFKSRLLAIVSSYLGIAVISLTGLSLQDDVAIAIALPFHFAIFAIGTFAQTELTGKALNKTEAWSFFPVLLFFYAAEYFFINRLNPSIAPWASLCFAGLLIGLSTVAKKGLKAERLDSGGPIMAFSSIVFFHSIYLELMPEEMKPWLFVVICLLWSFMPTKIISYRNSTPVSLPILLIAAILIIEFMNMMGKLAKSAPDVNWLAVSFASVAALYTLYLRQKKAQIANENMANSILALAHILAVFALYRLLEGYGSLAVSASWLAYATAIIALGFQRHDSVMAKSALVALLAAGAKALIYDAASAPTGVRIFCLLLTGAVFYGCGFLFRKIAAWPTTDRD